MKVKKQETNIPENKNMETVKCWEVFRCDKKSCPAYESKDLKCWLFSGTHCRDAIQGRFLEKMEICLDCEVFRANRDVSAMRATLKVIDKQFKEFNKIIRARDKELEDMSMELALSLSEVFEALKKISSGDPTVRVPESSGVELISKLKHIVNLTAEEIGEIVEQSHEIAIGLAEHFDVLHKVSKGELNTKAYGISRIELLDSLKKVTNETIGSISREITERKRAEVVLKKRTNDLWKRVKELNCLYSISELFDREGISMEEMFQKTVVRIPFAWQYPEITCGRIILYGQEFRTKNFRETVWKQASPILVRGEQVGMAEVYYLEEMPDGDEGPFLKEERDLLNIIAKHSGRVIERMKAEETLRSSEEKYRTVFENTGNATIIVEEDTTISMVNTKFENLSGFSKVEIEGKKSWTEFFRKDDLGRMKEYHYTLRTDPNSAPTNFEARFVDRQGNTRVILLSASIIPGTKKTVESLLDITERRKLRDQMFHTEKLASIGTLAAGVAHEINNPLAIILGFTDLLLEKVPEDSEFYDLLHTIQKQGNNAKKIVENLLSFVRYKEYREEEMDVNKSIEEVLTVKGNTLAINNIIIQKDLTESLPVVKGDPGELQQVFFNLINNAIFAMKGGGILAVGTKTSNNGRSVEIRIADSGSGIDKEHRTKIFDPLFTTKKVGEGTGLGLTVSYAIIKKYGGEIRFETKTKEESADSGTTFIITLPAASLP